MGYDIAIPAGLLIAGVSAVLAVLLAKRRIRQKRLDFEKGTTYELPQEEGAPAISRKAARPPGDEGN